MTTQIEHVTQEDTETHREKAIKFLHNCRILSFEGNAGLELTSTLILKEIEKRRPGFMKHNNLILAGTSAGAIQAMVLATKNDPAKRLDEIETLWENSSSLLRNTLLGSGLALFGLGAMGSMQGLKKYLSKERLLGDKTLADLKKKVIVTSFKIKGASKWRPKIYNNFEHTALAEPDLMEKAVDVCLRSGAAPIFLPVVDGFIDGGTVAYNPEVISLAQILNEMRVLGAEETLKNVKVLSVGDGQYSFDPNILDANWGYAQWLFNPLKPLLVVQALYEGDVYGSNYQAKRFLPEGSYRRLNPVFDSPAFGSSPIWNSPANIRKTVYGREVQNSIDETVVWMDDNEW